MFKRKMMFYVLYRHKYGVKDTGTIKEKVFLR